MRGLEKKFEVSVKTGEKLKGKFIYKRGNGRGNLPELREGMVTHRRVNTFHVSARNKKSARIKAGKYGQVVHVRKVDVAQVLGDIEKLDLRQPPLIEYVTNSPYESAMAMGEMIWRKKDKRAERIKNKGKDKIYP